MILSSTSCTQPLENVASSLAGTSSRPSSAFPLYVDEATTLMILSCYCRLTDIYVSIFQKMQACINHPRSPMIEQDHFVVLPRLQVGLYRPAAIHVDSDTSMPCSTTSVFMLMTTMVSTEFYNQLVEVMTTGICSQVPGPCSDREQNLPVQTEKEDEDAASQESTSLSQSSFGNMVHHTITSRTEHCRSPFKLLGRCYSISLSIQIEATITPLLLQQVVPQTKV